MSSLESPRPLSLSRRLLVRLFPVLAMVLLGIQLLNGWIQYQSQMSALKTKADAIALLTAAAIAQPLWVFDRQIYEGQIRALNIDDEFVYARIVDDQGQEIFSYGDTASDSRHLYILSLPVSEPFQERTFAAFELGWSLQGVQQVIWQTVFVGLLLFGLTFGALYLILHWAVRRSVLQPLQNLVQALRRIALKDWHQLDIDPKLKRTEWAEVFTAFNRMTMGLRSGDEARQYVDELKATQEAMRDQHEAMSLLTERLHLATQAGKIGIWDYDVLTGERTWNDEMYELYGHATGALEQDPLLWENSLHPEHRERAMENTQRALARKEVLEDEFRIIRGDGKVRWIKTSGRVLRNGTGTPIRFLGTNMDITASKAQEEALQAMAHFDALTGLPNRRLLLDRLQQAIARSQRQNTLLAVVMMDLDGFKAVNDAFGHDAGDHMLTVLAERMTACIRQEDTLARLGGDEFVLLLGELHNEAEIEQTLARILATVGEPVNIQDQSTQVSTSMGVTLFPADGSTAETLLRHADQAMYQAKRAGKNCVRYFSSLD